MLSSSIKKKTESISARLQKRTYMKPYLLLKTKPSNLIINPRLKPYNIDEELEQYYEQLNILIISKELDELDIKTKSLYEGITRSVARYISNNYKMQYKVSNGFVKLWEIYNMEPDLLHIINTDGNINVFHMAEAPGQWIHATDYYIYTNIVNARDTRQFNYNWYANALNPYNPANIALFGTDIFKDNYGFIGRYQNRWLYGKDGTGDLTKSSTIKWMQDFLHNKYNAKDNNIGPLQLITGDGGLSTEQPLLLMQRLDLAQVLTVLACSMKGGNCVVKHFLPYIANKPESRDGNALYFNIFYLYYSCFKKVKIIKPQTSSPMSSEIYIVGFDFQGIDDKILNKLYYHLDNMTENECFIKENDMTMEFKKQLTDYFAQLYSFNIKNRYIRADIIKCQMELNKKKKGVNYDNTFVNEQRCSMHFNQSWINKFLSNQIKDWINKFNFN